ncbi:CapA family protein [Luedemannella helvata]|uniref:CapA family protein n=1 Tax=Luedemannella helvata TaxID=349315 RepID=A0ABN2KEX5_9ACTN
MILPPSTRRRTTALLIAALMAAPMAACDNQSDPPAAAPTAAATRSSPTATPSPTGPAEFTLAFAGDIHFVERTRGLLKNPATALGPIGDVLADADVTMVNLETAITERGTPEPKRFHFRAPDSAYPALAAAGVDVVSLANNHALDYGRVGLTDTLESAEEAGMPTVGAGRTAADAYAPWIAEVKGVKVAFLGLSQIAELADRWAPAANRSGVAMAFDEKRSVAAVKAARKKADIVVVYLHWGYEGVECPNSQQKSFAGVLSRAGADLIVGVHSHLLQGGGWLNKNTYVQYGLGNFVWWRDDAWSNDTGVLKVTFRGTSIKKAELIPAVISRKTGQPIPVKGAEAKRVTKKYDGLRRCTGLVSSLS